MYCFGRHTHNFPVFHGTPLDGCRRRVIIWMSCHTLQPLFSPLKKSTDIVIMLEHQFPQECEVCNCLAQHVALVTEVVFHQP